MPNALHSIPGIAEITLELCISHKCPPHFHETYAVGLFRGAATSHCRERSWPIEPGQIAVHHPREAHWGDPVGLCAQDLLYVSPRLLMKLFGAAEPMHFPDPVIDDAELAAALYSALRLAIAGTPTPLRLAIQQLFLRHGTPDAASCQDTCQWEIAPAEMLLHGNVAAMSIEAGLSRSHFSRSFRRSVGLCPRDFRRQARVEAARAMIASGGTLADIAAKAGFADQAHMTRQFRAILGITPAAVKRQ